MGRTYPIPSEMREKSRVKSQVLDVSYTSGTTEKSRDIFQSLSIIYLSNCVCAICGVGEGRLMNNKMWIGCRLEEKELLSWDSIDTIQEVELTEAEEAIIKLLY